MQKPLLPTLCSPFFPLSLSLSPSSIGIEMTYSLQDKITSQIRPQPKRASIKESLYHILFDEAPRKLVLSTIIIYVEMKVECHTSSFGISFTKIPFFCKKCGKFEAI